MPKSRNTVQKETIQKELDKFTTFFTAEELFDKVKKHKIGIATVYRFLKDLVKRDELHSYVCERKTVYSKDKDSHCHFICQKCSKIVHFDVNSIDFLKKKMKGSICHFEIEVHGVCEDCE